MELASGKVRYEFSGPPSGGWYAAFLRDGRGFLASRLFEQSVVLWPTGPAAREDRAPPEPTATIKGLDRMQTSAAVSARGDVAFALDDGVVLLRRLEGEAPALAPPAGAGPSAVVFTPSGRHLVALRAGRVFTWPLPEPARAAPAATAPGPR